MSVWDPLSSELSSSSNPTTPAHDTPTPVVCAADKELPIDIGDVSDPKLPLSAPRILAAGGKGGLVSFFPLHAAVTGCDAIVPIISAKVHSRWVSEVPPICSDFICI